MSLRGKGVWGGEKEGSFSPLSSLGSCGRNPESLSWPPWGPVWPAYQHGDSTAWEWEGERAEITSSPARSPQGTLWAPSVPHQVLPILELLGAGAQALDALGLGTLPKSKPCPGPLGSQLRVLCHALKCTKQNTGSPRKFYGNSGMEEISSQAPR